MSRYTAFGPLKYRSTLLSDPPNNAKTGLLLWSFDHNIRDLFSMTKTTSLPSPFLIKAFSKGKRYIPSYKSNDKGDEHGNGLVLVLDALV